MENETADRPTDGRDKWEAAVANRLGGEFRRRSRIRWRQAFDDLVQDCLVYWSGVRKQLAHDPDNPPAA